MNKTLQQLADRWEAIAEEWRDILTSRKETYITCAAELREVLSRCNLTAEADAKPSSFNDWWHGDAIKNDAPIFADAYVACEATWQACEKRMEAQVGDLMCEAVKREWVKCPICGEGSMRKETDKDGSSLILCVNHNCGSNGGTNLSAVSGELQALRAELEALRWRDMSIQPKSVDADNDGYVTAVDQNGAMSIQDIRSWPDWIYGITHWRPAALPKPPDPFTAWRRRYMPDSSDDLAREAWEKAKGGVA